MAKKPTIRKVTVRPYRVPAVKGAKITRRFNPDKLPKRGKDGRFTPKARKARKPRARAKRAPAAGPALPGLGPLFGG